MQKAVVLYWQVPYSALLCLRLQLLLQPAQIWLKLQCPEYYSVRIVPYDAGDKISYKYEQRFNAKLVRNKIDELKASLTSNDSVIGDYRITKCYEASLIGLDMPYDIENLHQQRQSVRDEINKLEALIASKI